jgi:hypothetical protein
MPTIIGVDTVTSISRRVILPTITDVAYGGNALFYRLNAANKKQIAGGTHVEAPFIVSKWSNGGWYTGYDELDVSPSDTVINGGWDMKSAYVPVTVDGTTLTKCNTPEAIVNLLTLSWDQARMKMADILGDGVYSDGVTNPKVIDGLKGVVDNGAVATTYAGLLRSANPWLNAQVDSTTATLTLVAMRTMVGNCTVGGHSPTVILGRKEQYNRLWTLLQNSQRFVVQPVASDSQIGSAGFTNLYFDNIPFIVDDKCFDGPNASNSAILFLNEDYLDLYIANGIDFELEDFARPINQDAMTGKLYWRGNLLCTRPAVQGIMTAVAA